MEEEICYSTVVFKNADTAPKETTIHSEVKPKSAAATVPKADGEAAARSHFRVLAACLGILCVLLVGGISAIIYITVVLNKQKVNLSELKAQNQQLNTERSILQRETEELSRVTDGFNWTLGVILTFNTFPVSDYCPNKKCQPCRKDWILFQEKCYLFYDQKSPWKTWRESREYCQKTAADLVVVDSLAEQKFISTHIEYYYDEFHGYWIGLYENKDRNWVWLDGRKDTLQFWMLEPLGTLGGCALMIPRSNHTANWDPAESIMENKFVCESDALIRCLSEQMSSLSEGVRGEDLTNDDESL